MKRGGRCFDPWTEAGRLEMAKWEKDNPWRETTSDFGDPIIEHKAEPVDKFDKIKYILDYGIDNGLFDESWSVFEDEITGEYVPRRYEGFNIVSNNLHRSGGDLTLGKWHMLKRAWGERCAYCNKQSNRLQLDHIIPVAEGGATDLVNVVPACAACNSKKHAQAVASWLGDKYYDFKIRHNAVLREIQ